MCTVKTGERKEGMRGEGGGGASPGKILTAGPQYTGNLPTIRSCVNNS